MLDPSRSTEFILSIHVFTALFLVPSAYRRPYNASFKEEMRLATPTFFAGIYMINSKHDHHNLYIKKPRKQKTNQLAI